MWLWASRGVFGGVSDARDNAAMASPMLSHWVRRVRHMAPCPRESLGGETRFNPGGVIARTLSHPHAIGEKKNDKGY